VDRGGRSALEFTDPEGQCLQLADDGGAPGGRPWPGSPVPAAQFIRGLDSVTLVERRLSGTGSLLTEVLKMSRVRSYERDGREVAVFAMGAGGPGAEVHVEERPDLPPGRVGAGGVHHVAFRTPNAQEQQEWLARIRGAGLSVSDVIDRYYFRSIYFREPGGVLFEIATDGPGFATDETLETLGGRLSLPPFLEPQRAAIEAGLAPLG
jgi:glyoxalase family protein